MSGDLERIRRLLGTPDTAWFLARMRARLDQKGLLDGTVTKQNASTAERMASARLTGRAVRPGSSASVSLDQLDDALRRDAWPEGLAAAVVALTGPVVGRAARRAARESWQQGADTLRGMAIERPWLSPGVDGMLSNGGLRRATATAEAVNDLAFRLARLVRELPAEGEVLGVLAARLFGDAHALDAKAPLGSIAAGLAAVLASLPAGKGAGWRRSAWLACGVVVDELSSTVLAVGLPGGAGSPTARALAALTTAGQPAVLT
ncbi:MAG: TIGR02679 domain-containing protein [Cryobacterium sp.]|uniref:TIGR02679 domain-containing protein n=1 Tax=Cryobacterium sp. TaxID=1926290 RepID=UPI00229AF126|nr:TIGR02679 domain-containing protein [Cryobacterium sp.]MCY7405072.1 TIGR02679 domain-containing protein [Cryobacterium sp.]